MFLLKFPILITLIKTNALTNQQCTCYCIYCFVLYIITYIISWKQKDTSLQHSTSSITAGQPLTEEYHSVSGFTLMLFIFIDFLRGFQFKVKNLTTWVKPLSLFHYKLVRYLFPVLHSELHDGLSSFKHQWQLTVFWHSVIFLLQTNKEIVSNCARFWSSISPHLKWYYDENRVFPIYAK